MFPCSQSVQGGHIGSVRGQKKKLLYRKSKDVRLGRGQWCGCWESLCLITTFFYRLRPPIVHFSYPPFSVSFSVRRGPNWLHQAKAGRQAEGWSVKLVNHFPFSLRTAVDWWERPLCPPSQPASKFAASPFQWMAACRGGRRRRKRGFNTSNVSMFTRTRAADHVVKPKTELATTFICDKLCFAENWEEWYRTSKAER